MKILLLFLLFLLFNAPVFSQKETNVIGADGEIVFTFATDTPDPVMRQIPREIILRRQSAPATFVTLLAAYINEKASCDYDRVKKVHDWVALNIRYDTASYFSGRYSSQAADAVIKRGSAVCAGYADVFKMICDALEIESVVVSGFARGFGRRLYEVENTSNTNHAWNIVTIDGKSFLIDTTWDAGHVNGQTFRARYKTEYLFADPAVFIYDHFPMYKAHQLLDPPLSADEFTNLPFLKPLFFMAVKTWPDIGRITEIKDGEEPKLEFTLYDGYDIGFQWHIPGGGTGNSTIYPGRRAVYTAYIPKRTGRMSLRIYIKKPGDQTYWSCGEFGFDVK